MWSAYRPFNLNRRRLEFVNSNEEIFFLGEKMKIKTINEAKGHEIQEYQRCLDRADCYTGLDKSRYLEYAENHKQVAEWLECFNEIVTLYIEHRQFNSYPTTKEEYADETMKILDKYKIK